MYNRIDSNTEIYLLTSPSLVIGRAGHESPLHTTGAPRQGVVYLHGHRKLRAGRNAFHVGIARLALGGLARVEVSSVHPGGSTIN